MKIPAEWNVPYWMADGAGTHLSCWFNRGYRGLAKDAHKAEAALRVNPRAFAYTTDTNEFGRYNPVSKIVEWWTPTWDLEGHISWAIHIKTQHPDVAVGTVIDKEDIDALL